MIVDILGYSGSLQTIESSNSSLLVREDSTSILVDTSSSPAQLLLKNDVDPDCLDAVVLTHAHIDHIYGYPSLIHNLWMRKRRKKLIVIGNENSIRVAKELLILFKMNEKKDLMPIEYSSDRNITIGGISIERFDVFHRPHMPTSGYTFSTQDGKLSYFPDSVATPPYPECALSSDILIHEAGSTDEFREKTNSNGHTTGYQAGMVAKETGAKKLVLIHLPPNSDNLHEKILLDAKKAFSNTYLPRDAKKLVINKA